MDEDKDIPKKKQKKEKTKILIYPICEDHTVDAEEARREVMEEVFRVLMENTDDES